MHPNGELVNHDRYEQLAALAATGQLQPAEYAEFVNHLEVCSACQKEFDEYLQILHNQFPLLHSAMAPSPEPDCEAPRDDELKSRFFARARAEGLPFAAAPDDPRELRTRSRPRVAALAFGYAAAVVLIAVAGGLAYQWRQAELTGRAQAEEVRRLNERNDGLREQLSGMAAARGALASEGLSAAHAKNVELSARYDALGRELKAASDEIEALRAQAQVQAQAAQDKESRLSHDLEGSRAAIGQMAVDLDKLRNARIEDALALEDRQARVEQLQKQLSAQTQSLDRSRRLLAADRDIRELMGARDLHITDVYDVDAKGKTRQLFGRVFYTKEKSLVFYAFDLQNPQVSKASEAFQAWGYKESSKQVTRSLGIFFLDDKNQNRWALKFDNPEVLAEIDAVFVTVEPPGGSAKPTGQKLLYAFLRGDVNHP